VIEIATEPVAMSACGFPLDESALEEKPSDAPPEETLSAAAALATAPPNP
jgi:hypothetical protein